MNTTIKLIKKTILITMLALLGITQAIAQEYEYVPFVREGVKWVYFVKNTDDLYGWVDHNLPEADYYLTLELKGDTVINGLTYKAMHKYYGDNINAVNDTIPIYLREDDKVVYGINPDGMFYHDCPIYNNCSDVNTYNGQEFVLYDFKNPIEYWSGFTLFDYPFYEYQSTDTIVIGNHAVKRYNGLWSDVHFQIIEGVGADTQVPGYTLSFFMSFGKGIPLFQFSHLIENDEIIYKSKWFEEPQPDEYEYVPFVREGVKWVYFYENYYSTLYGYDENLALGKNYLTLEIKGDTIIDGKTYKAMHKYSGSAIDWEHDTIPIYLREEDQVVYGIVPDCMLYHDCPIGYGPEYQLLDGLYGQIWNGQEFVLYDFSDTKSYYESDKMFDPDLFDEFEFSYIGSDMITVGGAQVKRHVCSRWNVEDYIIERIGFDGHNSGFTLHYFYSMTWADPRFHLSHVIENDEIIYKGIHYHPNVPGDVNGDGEVTIADANNVVDIVVMGGNSGHTRAPQADVNGDDEINIADINAIIDLIIKND